MEQRAKQGRTMPQKNQDLSQGDRFSKKGSEAEKIKPERDQDQASRQYGRTQRDLNTNVR